MVFRFFAYDKIQAVSTFFIVSVGNARAKRWTSFGFETA